MFYVKSEQDSPTLYFSFLPQFAKELKELEKGIVFIGKNFILGLLGTTEKKDLVDQLEEIAKKTSSKPVKAMRKDNVKFDFKIKGQKPVVTKDICQFNITGADFKLDEIEKLLKEHTL